MNLIAVATSDYIGAVLLIALLFSSRIRRNANSNQVELKLFSLIAILGLVACFVDFFAFFADGRPGPTWRIINILANTFCFLANPLFISCWCLFEDLKFYHSMKRVKKIYVYAFIPALVLEIIALLNMFVPIIFFMDEQNRYVRLPFSYAYYVVDLFYLLFGIYILEKYQEKYGKVRFFPIFLMMGPVVMGCILQVFFYGISLIWVSLAVGMTSIYMSLQNEFSYQDKLTGLYNRAYLDYCLESALKGKGKGLGGIMIDVDYFKKINDTYGHSAGDEALVDVTRIINFSKPDKAIATRFAGDEFILLVKDTSDDEMKRIIKNIHDEVDLFNETEGREYKLSLSTGYAIYDPKSESLDDFLKHMDDNMYEEKNLKHGK